MEAETIQLNGFEVTFSAPSFTAYIQDMNDNAEFRDLREELDPWWFLYWRDGKVYGLPKGPKPILEFGEPIRINCDDALSFLAARIISVLPEALPEFPMYLRRPFSFFAGKDLVQRIISGMRNVPSIVNDFKIRPRYEFDTKIIEPIDGHPFIGIFLRVRMRWEVIASLEDLEAAGVDLHGLYVVLREPEPDQRRLIGRIERLSNGLVTLSESYDNRQHIESAKVCLEGSRASFARSLKTILGGRYKAFEDGRDNEEAKYYTGQALDGILARAEEFLGKRSPLDLGSNIECRIVQRIEVSNSEKYQSVVSIPAVEYLFDPARTKRNLYAWPGIERYGPYSRDTFAKKTPKVLVLFPDTVQGQVERFLRQFRDGISNQWC